MNVEKKRPRGVGGVGGVDLAAGQPPDEKRIDRAEAELAAFGLLACTLHVVQQPRDLGGGEIRVEEQAGFRRNLGLVTGGAKRGAYVGCAPVLPDDRAMDRLAGLPVPDDHRLALVGDADGGDIGWLPGRRVADRRAARRDNAPPYIFGIVLHPAGLGKELGEF